MKRAIWLCLGLLLFVTGCSAVRGTPAAAPPETAEVSLEEWAERYPQQYKEWAGSVHGTAYLAGNTDAPGCTGCHGDPESGEIETAAFHNGIPAACARCHADGALMASYDVAADVYDTYQADYHGMMVEYYRAKDPDTWRYEAVCSDCHGAHAVYAADDPQSSVAAANLLATCQQCHQGAEASFADSGFGHYRTDRTAHPLVYWIGNVYRYGLIPGVIGLMLAYIALDIVHRLRGPRAAARDKEG